MIALGIMLKLVLLWVQVVGFKFELMEHKSYLILLLTFLQQELEVPITT